MTTPSPQKIRNALSAILLWKPQHFFTCLKKVLSNGKSSMVMRWESLPNGQFNFFFYTHDEDKLFEDAYEYGRMNATQNVDKNLIKETYFKILRGEV